MKRHETFRETLETVLGNESFWSVLIWSVLLD